MDDVTTFWDRADKTGACWLWAGSIDKHGYGRYKTFYAHRYAFELHTSTPIRPGRQIDHMCRVRNCINPAHLRSVSNKQNQENREGPNRNGTSGVLGVTWNKRHKMWCAKFKHNGKGIYVGMYKDLAEAAEAIRVKRNKVYTCNLADRPMANLAATVKPLSGH